MQSQQSTNVLACTLSGEELKVRRQLLRKTLQPYINSVDTEPRGLNVRFSNTINISHIEKFVALERQCCSFFNFKIVPLEDIIELQISGPEGSEAALQEFAEGAME